MPSRSRTVIPLLLHTVLLTGCGGGQRPGTLPAGGEHQAHRAPKRRQQRGFNQELNHDLAAPRAQGLA